MIQVAIVKYTPELESLWRDILSRQTEGSICIGSFGTAADIVQKVSDCFSLLHPPPQYAHLLTDKERAVLALLARGCFYKEIAIELSHTTDTIKQYCHVIYKKLGVANRTEAVNRYFQVTIP